MSVIDNTYVYWTLFALILVLVPVVSVYASWRSRIKFVREERLFWRDAWRKDFEREINALGRTQHIHDLFSMASPAEVAEKIINGPDLLAQRLQNQMWEAQNQRNEKLGLTITRSNVVSFPRSR